MHALYQQLDDKDDDINKHTQTIARLRQQLEEQEEMLRTARLEAETSLADVAQLQVGFALVFHYFLTIYILHSVVVSMIFAFFDEPFATLFQDFLCKIPSNASSSWPKILQLVLMNAFFKWL